ncbi:MAG: hypothetical protein ACR2ML_01290 [Solirubrobacteraceae bacterium]
MTLPLLSRFVLVPDHRAAVESPPAPVRRYRLSRVSPEAPCDRKRYAYLKKSHD